MIKNISKEKLIAAVQDTASYKVMMLLEDGFAPFAKIEKNTFL
jgi:hypothetical protein